MKTGTITFHAPNNNGSFLQACVNDRIDGLLGQLNLNDRTVSKNDNCSEIIQRPIDYCMVNQILDGIREKEIDYLKRSLHE